MSEVLKTQEDFNSPVEFDAYCLTLLAHKLNPKVNQGYAFERIFEFLLFLVNNEEGYAAEAALELADDILSGPPSTPDVH